MKNKDYAMILGVGLVLIWVGNGSCDRTIHQAVEARETASALEYERRVAPTEAAISATQVSAESTRVAGLPEEERLLYEKEQRRFTDALLRSTHPLYWEATRTALARTERALR